MFKKIQIPAWECKCDNQSCGHEWISYTERLPTHCPKKGCSNPTKWNSGGTKQKRKKPTVKTISPESHSKEKPAEYVDDSIVSNEELGIC